MYRLTRLMTLALVLTTYAVPTAHGSDWYVAGRGGYATDSGFGIAGAIGREWDWPPGYAGDLRAELEVTVRRNETDNAAIGYVWSIAEMANLYLDVHTASKALSPYLGVGIGLVTADNGTDTDHAAAYQGMAGLRWRTSASTSLIAEYRFLTAPGLDLQSGGGGTPASTDYQTHHVLLGMAFRF
jgi:opacity protein-like surface antigen